GADADCRRSDAHGTARHAGRNRRSGLLSPQRAFALYGWPDRLSVRREDHDPLIYSTITSAGVLRKALTLESTPFSMPLSRNSSSRNTPAREVKRYSSQNPFCTLSITVLVAGAPRTVR